MTLADGLGNNLDVGDKCRLSHTYILPFKCLGLERFSKKYNGNEIL